MNALITHPHAVSSARAFTRLLATLSFFGAVFFLGADVRAAAFAVSFDGANDHVTFGQAPALGSTTFTIETWFKRAGPGVGTSTGSGGVTAIPLVAKGRAEADGSNQDMNYFLGIRASDNVLCADFEEGAGGVTPGLNHPIAGVTPIATNVWYHAAVTYDGAKWQLFLNGVLESELIVNRPPRADSIQRASLASALNSTGAAAGFFHGVLDEVRVWNYARTAQQIAANMNAEITGGSGLSGRWGLNEGSGTIASNSSGSTNGTLLNGPLWVAGFQQTGPAVITRGPYLQMGTPTSVLVRWRTDIATNSRVRYGTVEGSLSSTTDHGAITTEHQVQLAGLTPDTQYFYSVGSTTATLASGADFTFFTAPPAGAVQPMRIWVLGDSGTGTSSQTAVRDAYAAFNGTRHTDLWLMLGDNVYETGTDAEYQTRLFDIYPTMLRQSVLWPAVGNHDTAGSTNPPLTIPYFEAFTMPANGEAGGAPSGTEKYYSFDFANVHFVCLDSMTSSRQPGSPMLTWLRADLESTTQDWIIAYWHHPPYSKGSHNSDTATESIEMRANVLPILEAGGVDLLLFGHSHNYERSFLIDGHYGTSTTFNSSMLVDGGDGRETGTGAYVKPEGLAANQGAVYVVAGTSGKVSNWTGGSTADVNPTPHPVMSTSLRLLGSLVIDVDGNRMDAKFLRETGAVDDFFTILKNLPNVPPTVSIASPANDATFTAPANITIAASAADSDGTIAQVDFYAGSTLIGADTSAPFEITWNNVAAGTYVLTAAATDNLGGTTTSAPISISVSSDGTTTVSFQDGANGYTGTRDTRIVSNSATSNYGTTTTLTTDGSPDTAMLVKWDVSSIPPGRQVIAATLTFNVTNATPHIYELYAVSRAWSETTATWNQASTGVNWQVAGANGGSDRSGIELGALTSTTTGLKTFTLNSAGLAQVKAWIDNPASNNGFVALDYAVTDALGVTSSETGTVANRPKLTITYQ